MPLTPVDLKIDLFLNDARDSYFLEDTTNQYSPTNPNGYGLPGGITSTSVVTVTVTMTYTQLVQDLVYIFTVSSGTITACTMSFAGATPVSIISEIASTVWPFTSANRFELTGDYGITLPTLADMVYEVSYEIEGTMSAQAFDYTTDVQDLMDVSTNCCLSKELVKLNVQNVTGQENVLKGYGYLLTAHSAVKNGNIPQANLYVNRAAAICNNMENCNCNCN